MANINRVSGWNSRKYRSAWLLTILVSGLLIVPPIFSVLLGLKEALILLGEGSYVTFLTIIWSVYFSANVAQKIFTSNNPEDEVD